MTFSRVARIPFEHLSAEIAAFPIASESSFRLAVTHLSPHLSPTFGAAQQAGTGALWRDAEQSLLGQAPAVAVDESTALRDLVWFGLNSDSSGDSPGDVPLASLVQRTARRHLRDRGATAAPCLVGSGDAEEAADAHATKPRARESFQWLSFALPPDLLLAALGEPGANGPLRIEDVSPQVEELLNRLGFAEPHQHLGAGIEFPVLWISAQLGVLSGLISQDSFASPGAAFDEGRTMAPWLLRSAVVRILLACFLQGRSSRRPQLDFTKFFDKQWPGLTAHLGLVDAFAIRSCVLDLAAGHMSSKAMPFARIQQAANHLSQASRRTSCLRKAAHRGGRPGQRLIPFVHQADPISAEFPPLGGGEVTSEFQLTRCGFDYLQSPTGVRDRLFQVLFWQTVRMRNLLYRHVVQRPMTPGLQWFTRTYGRLGPVRAALPDPIIVESALELAGSRQGLRSLEVRTSPGSSVAGMYEFVQDAIRRVNGLRSSASGIARGDLEFGFVLHFVRDRGGGMSHGYANINDVGTHADPSASSGNRTGYRFARFYMDRRQEAVTLAQVLLRFPSLLATLRGIDVCNDEVGVPAWVLAPLFRYLRNVSGVVSRNLERHGVRIPPLKTTIHAGEDFTHLLGGLRRIDESIRYYGLREGDRLGHCVALGIDATDWARSAGRVTVPREERLLDLIWEWSCYGRLGAVPRTNRRAYLERELDRLTFALFRRVVPPFQLERFVAFLHDGAVLSNRGFPTGIRTPYVQPQSHWQKIGGPPRSRDLRLLDEYLTSRAVFVRGRQIEFVDPAAEAEALEEMQMYLRKRIAALGLSVEVNPTSNLLIGQLSDLTRHPLWRLNSPVEDSSLPPVPLCIGSDDPATFATRLPREYSLVADSLVLGELTTAQSHRWLNEIRENSLRSRFTVAPLQHHASAIPSAQQAMIQPPP